MLCLCLLFSVFPLIDLNCILAPARQGGETTGLPKSEGSLAAYFLNVQGMPDPHLNLLMMCRCRFKIGTIAVSAKQPWKTRAPCANESNTMCPLCQELL